NGALYEQCSTTGTGCFRAPGSQARGHRHSGDEPSRPAERSGHKLVTTLNDTLGRIARDGSVRVVVLTGAGRAFCAGGDLALIGQDRSIAATRDLELLLASGTQAVLTMRSM